MSVRLIVTIEAKPGQGAALAAAYKQRCVEVMNEPGCEHFEIFQSAVNPDTLVLLERWADQAALDVHAQLNTTRPPLAPELRAEGVPAREDYEYNRTR
jgi:quinol monooxygenase YgiN